MAIAFSYSGLTQEVLDCTAEAQRHNCPVVAVTKVDGSSNLATMADAVLGVAASEPLVRSGAMASRMAQLMVVAYRTKCVSTLGASAQVDAPFSAV